MISMARGAALSEQRCIVSQMTNRETIVVQLLNGERSVSKSEANIFT